MDSWEPSPLPPASTSKRKARGYGSLSPERGSRVRDTYSTVTQIRSDSYVHDVYIPPTADSIPQRRGRERDFSDVYPETENKRRRLEEDTPPRRMPTSVSYDDSPSITTALLPSRFPPSEPELIRAFSGRKRAPLPPQSERFKQSKAPDVFVPPTPAAMMETKRAPPNANTPMRPGSAYTDVPSGPRNQGPPNKAGGRARTRFDAPGPVPLAGGGGGDSYAMDIDPPVISRPPASALRRDDPHPPRPTYLERNNSEMQVDPAPPRGPRAMYGAGSAPAPPATYAGPGPRGSGDSAGMGPGQGMPGGRPARQPPPHMTVQAGWAPEPNRSAGPTPSRFDDVRDYPPGGSSARRNEPLESRMQDTRDPPVPRQGRGAPAGPQVKLSGTNATPIGTRRNVPTGPMADSPVTPQPPADRFRGPPTSEPAGRFSGQQARGYPEEKSPTTRYREPLPPADAPHRRHSMSSRDLPPEPLTVNTQSVSESSRRNSNLSQNDRPRSSRFGPERSATPPQNEARVWMTRQESLELSRTAMSGPSSASSWSATFETEERFVRQVEANPVPPQRDGYTPPGPARQNQRRRNDAEPIRERAAPRDVPPSRSLEGRISRFDDAPPEHDDVRGAGRSYNDDEGYNRERGYDSRESHSQSQSQPQRAPINWDRLQTGHTPPRRTMTPPPPTQAQPRPHPERARFVDPHPLPPPPIPKPDFPLPPPPPIVKSNSKAPARGNRRQGPGGRSPVVGSDMREGNGSAYVDGRDESMGPPHFNHDDHLRPPVKRGGSLLERLSLEEPPNTNSLRDRVDTGKSMERDPGPPGGSASNDEGMGVAVDGDASPVKGGRGRRRTGKPRRGRRNGVA
ncbi:hypothetical protein K474DRAFT_628817 [Panus rudis PR-1116 ss-1]|nr:hypothetical protein K474DRAFT_628817 [Panus rudis PR-1116 ss-1]